MSDSIKIDSTLAHHLMEQALAEAQLGAASNEVPVGAVVWHGGKIIARAHNKTEALHIPSAHAEHLAIDAAAQTLGKWRLDDVILAITLEPCSMCAGLIRQARIPVVVFGAHDERMGAGGSLYDLLSDSRLGAPVRVIRDVCAEQCRTMLKKFFAHQR